MVMLAGPVTRPRPRGPIFRTVESGPAGNLSSPDGSNTIYGY